MTSRLDSMTTSSGRRLEFFVDAMPPDDAALLLYHHGTPAAGPIEPDLLNAARANGLLTVELVRPGYGGSDRQPGRTVADIADLSAELADHLGHDRFVTLGWSGGGPHALATAALLPDRCAGAVSWAGVGPFDAPGLDFLAGMGQDNIEEFGAAMQGAEALAAYLEPAAAGLRGAAPDEIVDQMRSLLPLVDQAVITGRTGEQWADVFRWAVSSGIDGWFDDDIAFISPWGFEPSAIRVPVTAWQGEQDLMVPVAHVHWLAGAIPTAVAHVHPDDGHLSLVRHMTAGLRQARDWLGASS